MMPNAHRSRQPVRPPWPRERLLRERAVLLGFNLAPSTQLTYLSGLHSYEEFCRKHGFPLDPTVDTITFFITYMATYVQPSTIANYLTGVTNLLALLYPQVRDIRLAPLVKQTLQGAKRVHSRPLQRKQHLEQQDLIYIQSELQQSNEFDDVLFLAIVFVGWHGLMRPNELTRPSNDAAFDPSRLMMRHDVIQHHTFVRLLLPAHKADPFFAGHDIIIQQDSDLQPVQVFNNYLKLRDARFPFCPLLWMCDDASTPTYSWLVDRLHRFFGPSVGGSSLRSGGANYLASIGTPHHVIQVVMGKFSSELNCLFFVNFEPELRCSVQTCLNLNTELEVQCSEFKVQFKMLF